MKTRAGRIFAMGLETGPSMLGRWQCCGQARQKFTHHLVIFPIRDLYSDTGNKLQLQQVDSIHRLNTSSSTHRPLVSAVRPLALHITTTHRGRMKAINAPSLPESPTSNLIRFAHLEPPFPAHVLGFRLQCPSSDSFLSSLAGSPQSLVAATPPDHSARLPMQDEDPMQR